MDYTKIEEMITQIREELHVIAESCSYDFQNDLVIEKSIELDKLLNLYESMKDKRKR